MPVAFDTSGMEQYDERTWFDPRTGDQVSLTYIGLVPDLPAGLDDLPLLRQRLTVETAEVGALIEAHVVFLDQVPTLFQLLKVPIPNQDSGQAFIAAFTVPKATCSAVLRIQCAEGSTTGVREATVFGQVGVENYVRPHPYAPEVSGRLPWHVADDGRWDAKFPDHPLSRARAWVHRTMSTARIDPGFAGLPPFRPVPVRPEAGETETLPRQEANGHPFGAGESSGGFEPVEPPPRVDSSGTFQPLEPFADEPRPHAQPTMYTPSAGSAGRSGAWTVPPPEGPKRGEPLRLVEPLPETAAPRPRAAPTPFKRSAEPSFAPPQAPAELPSTARAEPSEPPSDRFEPFTTPPVDTPAERFTPQPTGQHEPLTTRPTNAPAEALTPPAEAFTPPANGRVEAFTSPADTPAEAFISPTETPAERFTPLPTAQDEPFTTPAEAFTTAADAPAGRFEPFTPPPADTPAARFTPQPTGQHEPLTTRPTDTPASGFTTPTDTPVVAFDTPAERFITPPPAEPPTEIPAEAFTPRPTTPAEPLITPPTDAPAEAFIAPAGAPAEAFIPPADAPAETFIPPADAPAETFTPPAEAPAETFIPPAEAFTPPAEAPAEPPVTPPTNAAAEPHGQFTTSPTEPPQSASTSAQLRPIDSLPSFDPPPPQAEPSFDPPPAEDPPARSEDEPRHRAEPQPPADPDEPHSPVGLRPVEPLLRFDLPPVDESPPPPNQHLRPVDPLPPVDAPAVEAADPIPVDTPVTPESIWRVPTSEPATNGSGPKPRRRQEDTPHHDVMHTVLVGLPIGDYLPLWQTSEITYWRMTDPDVVRARLGLGLESRSEIDNLRFREAAMLTPDTHTLFLMDRFRDRTGHLGGTTTQLVPATEEEAHRAADDKAMSELYGWLGEVVLAAAERSEFVAVETGGWSAPESPVVLIMLRSDGDEWHSVVETSPVPVGAPIWRDQQPVDGDTQLLVSPATDQTMRAAGLLTRFAVATWSLHPFQLSLSFGPNPTLGEIPNR